MTAVSLLAPVCPARSFGEDLRRWLLRENVPIAGRFFVDSVDQRFAAWRASHPTAVTWHGDLTVASPSRMVTIGFVAAGGGGAQIPITLSAAESAILGRALNERLAEPAGASAGAAQ